MTEFIWKDEPVTFLEGETIASALRRAGHECLGRSANGQSARYFCGIGQCQGCLVSTGDGAPVEACITRAMPQRIVEPAFESVMERK
ncbi:2Fe-2S iron-sulfur cluster-binding protein [Paraburkholderia lycopersici]|uniref:2Fe-2S iron-sulfur cluster binding domain-containing protein n=1 Tax=Paraburkholderia lycopersici TaxID=416944 RepID=A0A1G6PAK5_9BURK|nr:2Fe-2S iron-sulfur cluster-binding protein [Paraburkholderia lycopersici]SDC77031.1 2Fe-2S iron-sulfur cluster binding domain-containing protein [Paraburkholderia lycopersici]